jgi:hypothetical protein
MEHKGGTYYRTTLSWIGRSDTGFCKTDDYSLEEFKCSEQEWHGSERAKRYGLDKRQGAITSQVEAAREKRRKAKVAARRQLILSQQR